MWDKTQNKFKTCFAFVWAIFLLLVFIVGVGASGDQLPRVLNIMPPKSLDGDSAQAPGNSRASDGKDPFIEPSLVGIIEYRQVRITCGMAFSFVSGTGQGFWRLF